jgi:geranylgeranyl transferase type-2 subunit alpha
VEIKANAEKLEKIVIINQTLLNKRGLKDYSEQTLAQTEKFSYLSPDFYTLWNYRREIITHLFEGLDTKQRLDMIKAELELLMKNIGRSPKSYTLWYHRQWTIELGIKEESKTGEWQS